MSELQITEIVLPGSPIASLNPYPQLPAAADKAFALKADDDIPERLRDHFGYGVSSAPMDPCLPYLLQDDYDRNLQPMTLRCAKLSNDKIEATILLDYGARVWKLWDKVNKRDLVYENSVFQPCNFAVRNAWLAGGIEWNVGVRGHGVFTSDKLFAATLHGADGEPILRVWEYERTRKIAFQMDFFLCGDEPKLAVHVAVCNTTDHVVPLYWWSNIAVREQFGHRVVAHGEKAICHRYGGRLSVVDVDQPVDLSSLKHHDHVGDYFYYGESSKQSWIAAVEPDGYGLLQTATSVQKGRKLFAWGQSTAAKNWQKMLSHEPVPYFEIQAGVAPTQYGSEPLAPGHRAEWIECYGPLQVEPGLAASGSPDVLRAAASLAVHQETPGDGLERLLSRHRSIFDRPPEKLVQRGSGWGAVELQAAGLGDHWKDLPGARFPETSLGEEQQPWVRILTGQIPDLHPDQPHPSYMIDPCWSGLLDGSPELQTAWSHVQQGVCAYAAGQLDKAEEHFNGSLKLRPSATAHVCLAQLHRNAGEFGDALAHAREAIAIKPDDKRLQVLLANALVEAGEADEALRQIEQATQGAEPQGRLRIAAIAAHLDVGNGLEARELLERSFTVPDLREAESKLGQLWKLLISGEDTGDSTPTPTHLLFVADPNFLPMAGADSLTDESCATGLEKLPTVKKCNLKLFITIEDLSSK